MTDDVLGMELSRAKALLAARGYCVTEQEVRSRKGVPIGEARVIRVRETAAGLTLSYAVFQTDVQQPE